MDAFVIDAFEFCRHKEQREGEIAVADLPRLADETVDRTGSLRWHLAGGSNLHGHPQLELAVQGSVQLVCQRCLKPLDFAIESSAVVVLAPDEGSADVIDEQLAEESVEVIVGSTAFDIRQLIEDEALLAIPLSPRHATCPDQVKLPAEPAPEKESPFAVLKNLKK